MRASTVLFVIVIIIMWYFSAFYIAAPHEVHNMLFGGFGLTHPQHQLLGVMIFIASLVVISIWAVAGKGEEEKAEKAITPQGSANLVS